MVTISSSLAHDMPFAPQNEHITIHLHQSFIIYSLQLSQLNGGNTDPHTYIMCNMLGCSPMGTIMTWEQLLEHV